MQGIPRAGGTLGDTTRALQPFRKASLLPFEQLPNLPRPNIPFIDLDIGATSDLKAIQEHSVIDQKMKKFFATDGTTQTDDTHIVEVKDVTEVIKKVLQEVCLLRKELKFAWCVLEADYENKLSHRATELYCRVNKKVKELERQQKEKLEIVRGSYRQQLVNAIQKIAGEYKAYYDELLSGKSGRHDLKILELKEKLIEQERVVEVQTLRIEELTAELEELRRQEQEEEPPSIPSISLEEAEELRSAIVSLETQLSETLVQLAAKEDSEKKLTLLLNTTKKELETERGKVAQLKRDMEGLKRKSKAEQEKAARLAESQRAALEREMKEKVKKAQREAALEAQHEAEQQRLQNEAALEIERERSRLREQELRSQQSVAQPQEQRGGGELEAELARLQLAETRHKEEIGRIQKELERVNRVWSTKLAIMQKNFHALRDESFLRSSLQRQAAALHHATLGYAVNSYNHQREVSKENTAGEFVRTEYAQSPNGGNEDEGLSLPPPPSPSQSDITAPCLTDGHSNCHSR